MYRLDCLGDMCPLPIMKLMLCRSQLENGESVMVITDHSCTRESLLNYCEKQQLSATVQEPVTGVWEITIARQVSKSS